MKGRKTKTRIKLSRTEDQRFEGHWKLLQGRKDKTERERRPAASNTGNEIIEFSLNLSA